MCNERILTEEESNRLKREGRYISNESEFAKGMYNLMVRSIEDIEDLKDICEESGIDYSESGLQEIIGLNEIYHPKVVYVEDSVLHFGVQKYVELIEMEDLWDSVVLPVKLSNMDIVNDLGEIELRLTKAVTATDVNLDRYFCYGYNVDGLKDELFAHYEDAANIAHISRDYQTAAYKMLRELIRKLDEVRANEN